MNGAAAAQTTSFRTTSGHELDLPPVTSLDCAQLVSVLTKIGGTNYRPISPQRPSDPADGALYDYENAASARWATQCGGSARSQSFGTYGGAGGKWGFGR